MNSALAVYLVACARVRGSVEAWGWWVWTGLILVPQKGVHWKN